MSNEVKEAAALTYCMPMRLPPRDFGDIRRTSINANLFPFSPQPMTERGKYRIYAYHKNAVEVLRDLTSQEAFSLAFQLNKAYWKF